MIFIFLNITLLFSAAPEFQQGQTQVSEPDSTAIMYEFIREGIAHRNRNELDEALEKIHLGYQYGLDNDDYFNIYHGATQIGFVYLIKGDYDKMQYYFEKALDYSHRFEDRYFESIALNNLSRVYTERGEFTKAYELQRESLEIRYEVDDILYGTAVTLTSLGDTSLNLHRYRDSVRYYTEALETLVGAVEISERANNPVFFNRLYANLASVYLMRGNYDAKLSYLHKSVEIMTEYENERSLALSYGRLGNTYSHLNESDRAQYYFDKSRNLFEHINNQEKAALSVSYIRFLLLENQTDVAAELLSELVGWYDELESWVTRYEIFELKGDYHQLNGNFSAAAEAYARADSIVNTQPVAVRKPNIKWKILLNLAETDIESALLMAPDILELTEDYRRRVSYTGEAKAGFFSEYAPYYVDFARTLIRNGYYETAFDILEFSRARSFADELKIDLNSILLDSDSRLAERFLELQAEMIRVENLLASAKEMSGELQREWFEYQLSMESVLEELIEGHPASQAILNPNPFSSSELADKLNDGEAVLTYGFSRGQLSAVLIKHDEVTGWLVPEIENGWPEKMREIRKLIRNLDSADTIHRKLDEISGLLIPENQIKGVNRLWVAADGPLAYFPLELIRINENYLIEQATISYIPSATVRFAIREPQPFHQEPLLAFVNPDFGEFSGVPSVYREGLRPLPFTALEGRMISDFYPGEVQLYSSAKATEQRFKTEKLDSYRIIHLATHGILDERNPRFSGIVFSSPENPSDLDDGYLRVGEIYNLNLNADLVVLSACDTGLGPLLNGEGVLGFQRAFITAGARSVAVSLWNVHDRSTAVLMQHFYRYMGESTSDSYLIDYPAILRRAKLSMLGNPAFSHPAHWAPFILYGGD